MQAGHLRHRVSLYKPSGHPPSWSLLTTVWASVEPREAAGEQTGLRSPLETLIRIRHLTTVVPGLIADWGGRLFAVDAVSDRGGRGRQMVLSCHEYIGRAVIFNAGAPTAAIGFFIQNAEVINPDTYTMERHNLVELLQYQLPSVPAAGDTVTLDGTPHTIKGIAPNGDDGRVVRCIL